MAIIQGRVRNVTHPIQIILVRQLAAHLNVASFLVDPTGNLLFYNEPAEVILGRRFDDTGVMPTKEWSSAFHPFDDQGKPVPSMDLPLVITLETQQPAHKSFYIRGLKEVIHHIEVTSIPIIGLQNELLGAVALFWEVE